MKQYFLYVKSFLQYAEEDKCPRVGNEDYSFNSDEFEKLGDAIEKIIDCPICDSEEETQHVAIYKRSKSGRVVEDKCIDSITVGYGKNYSSEEELKDFLYKYFEKRIRYEFKEDLIEEGFSKDQAYLISKNVIDANHFFADGLYEKAWNDSKATELPVNDPNKEFEGVEILDSTQTIDKTPLVL